jgi:3-oxoacyl-[acyl-carrier-protein] synthase-3
VTTESHDSGSHDSGLRDDGPHGGNGSPPRPAAPASAAGTRPAPLRSGIGTAGSRILTFGHYQPANVVTNHDLAKRVETNDEWIRDRVGIAERRIAGPEESVVDMAVQAAGKALAASGLPAGDIDLVVVATCTLESNVPNASARVAERLGITGCAAFDLNTACSGFCYALAAVDSLVRTGTSRYALVVGAEKLSDWLDWDDRATCIIFADGAGAAVVGPSDVPGIGPVVWGSEGDKADLIAIKDRNSFLYQEGQPVFRWASHAMAPLVRQTCEAAGIDPTELAAFVPHQANLRIIDGLARRLGAPQALVARDIVTAGNTSSASIPLALSRMLERAEIASGAPVLLFGFGAGLTYAGQVIICP